MATLREFFGDEFETIDGALKTGGFGRDQRVQILREEAKRRQVIQEAPHQERIKHAQAEVEATGLPDWYTSDAVPSRMIQSLTETGARLLTSIPHQPYDENFQEWEQILKDGEKIDHVFKLKNRDSTRQAEKDVLEQSYADAPDLTGKIKAGLVNLADDAMHPSEYDVAGFVTEMVGDYGNLAAVGRGAIKGAVVNGLAAGGEAFASASGRSDKTSEDAKVEGILGGIVGAGTGMVFGLMPDGSIGRVKKENTTTKELQNDMKSELNEDGTIIEQTSNVGEDGMIIDAFKTERSTSAQEDFATIITEAEAKAVEEDVAIKAHVAELAEQGVSPEIIQEQLDSKIQPTPDDIFISDVITDDGVTLPNSHSGMRIVSKVLNEINNPDADVTLFYKRMRDYGYDAEISGAAMQAVIKKDAEIFFEVFANKINKAMHLKGEQLLEVAKAEALQNDIETTAKIHQNSSVDDLHVNEILELQESPRFNELMDYTRDITNTESRSPKKRISNREIYHENNGEGYETQVVGATYDKNYAYDFALSKAKVKRIEEGKATSQDIEDLKMDLAMLDENPLYNRDNELKYHAMKRDPHTIADIDEFDALMQQYEPERYRKNNEEASALFGEIEEPIKNPILDFIKEVASVKGNKVDYDLGTIKKSLVSKIKKSLNLDLSGYKRKLDNYSIRHILKEHGGENEYKRGQIPITYEDIAKIPDIIENAYEIKLEKKNKQGRDVISYKAKIGDEYFYFEEVRTGKKELVPQTMFKRKGESMPDTEVPSPLSSSEPSPSRVNDSITQNSLKSKNMDDMVYVGKDANGNDIMKSYKEIEADLDKEAKYIKQMEDCVL